MLVNLGDREPPKISSLSITPKLLLFLSLSLSLSPSLSLSLVLTLFPVLPLYRGIKKQSAPAMGAATMLGRLSISLSISLLASSSSAQMVYWGRRGGVLL